MPVARPNRRSAPLTFASLLLAGVGALFVAASAWRSERLPTLLAAAPQHRAGISWFLDGTWSQQHGMDRTPRSIVLLIHGLDEPGGIWDALAPALAEQEHRVARFDYPNDQPVRVSADAFADAADDLRSIGVQQATVVAHSMGGLVTRDALTRRLAMESPGLRVPLLITLGTPHLGSPWARWQPIAEAREQIQRWAESETLDPSLLFGWNADGMGEAGEDLRIGSPFLKDLNSRPHPESTRVACVVAVVAGITPGATIDAIPDLARALGDGVVPADSAAWEHADSVHIVRANHRSMIRPVELGEWLRSAFSSRPPPTPPAIPIVLELLGSPPDQPESSQTPP